MAYTAHADAFAKDNLPPKGEWPDLIFELPELQYPVRLNCAAELLDKMVAGGHGGRTVIRTLIEGKAYSCTYRQLLHRANRIAHVLTEDMGLEPGNRVLLRAPNNPMMAACWFAVTKAGLIVGVGQAAHVEHEIGIQRYSLLEAERLEQQRQARAVDFDQVFDPAAQGVGRELAGVDAMSRFPDLAEQFALARDALGHGKPAIAQGMAPPCFGKALEQGFILGLQKQQFHVHAFLLERRHGVRQLAHRGAAARVHAQGDAFMAGAGERFEQRHHQGDRQIVDAVVAAVFQDIERDALAGAGQTADQYQLHGGRISLACARRRKRCLHCRIAEEIR